MEKPDANHGLQTTNYKLQAKTMALSAVKQAHTIIDRAAHVMLAVPERASADAISSMIALYLALQSSKEGGIDEVSPQHVPTNLQFLPGSSQVQMQPRQQPEVTLDLAGITSVNDLRTESLQGGVRLHVALPEASTITKDQLEVSVRALPYDAVVTLGAADLEALGKIFADHPDFFYNTPIINIDHRAANEHFGTVNLVDITAGSIAETAYDLIVALHGDTLDAGIATALYAGIVAGTDSFQRPSTTPHSFQTAARLIELEADRDAVTQHLLKTKPLSLLKLSGRLYARLRVDQHIQLYWTLVRQADFRESNAKVGDLPQAMEELANNIAGYNAAFVLNDLGQQRFELYLMLGKGLEGQRQTIQEQLAARRENGVLHLTINATSLEEAEASALEKIRTILP